MQIAIFILVLVAFVCFVILAVAQPPNKWLGIGLAAFMLSLLIGGYMHVGATL